MSGERGDGVRGATLSVGDEELVVISLPWSSPDLGELTPAEAEVARLALSGFDTKEIARRRDVAPRTVSNHLASIYRKLGVSSRAELAAAVG